MQGLYQRHFSKTAISDIEAEFMVDNDMSKVDLLYFRDLLRGVHREQGELDKLIEPFLDRPINEVDPVELARWRQWRRKGAQLLVFANVHPGEIRAIEGMIAAGTARGVDAAGPPRADTDRADVQIIVAPRHPAKLARFRQALGGEGPGLAYWTGFGTLGTLYALGGTVVIGGGFDAQVGSHNPMEALRAGCVTVCGPHAGKQAALIALLEAEGLVGRGPAVALAEAKGASAEKADAGRLKLAALSREAEATALTIIDEAAFGAT